MGLCAEHMGVCELDPRELISFLCLALSRENITYQQTIRSADMLFHVIAQLTKSNKIKYKLAVNDRN